MSTTRRNLHPLIHQNCHQQKFKLITDQDYHSNYESYIVQKYKAMPPAFDVANYVDQEHIIGNMPNLTNNHMHH